MSYRHTHIIIPLDQNCIAKHIIGYTYIYTCARRLLLKSCAARRAGLCWQRFFSLPCGQSCDQLSYTMTNISKKTCAHHFIL